MRVLRLGKEIVPGYEKNLENRIHSLFPDQTIGWVGVPHYREGIEKGFHVFVGGKLIRFGYIGFEVTLPTQVEI